MWVFNSNFWVESSLSFNIKLKFENDFEFKKRLSYNKKLENWIDTWLFWVKLKKIKNLELFQAFLSFTWNIHACMSTGTQLKIIQKNSNIFELKLKIFEF